MKKYFISRNAQNVITYGITEFDGIIVAEGTTFETFPDETQWKQQLAHYQQLFPQEVLPDDPNYPVLPEEDGFPYPGRNIRVFISYKAVAQMLESPYKPLIDYALAVPARRNEEQGITIWLEELANEQMTGEQVYGVLESFGAIIINNV